MPKKAVGDVEDVIFLPIMQHTLAVTEAVFVYTPHKSQAAQVRSNQAPNNTSLACDNFCTLIVPCEGESPITNA